jgi:hypothetical protein
LPNSTFDNDAAVDDDTAPVADDDATTTDNAAPTTDDDAANNDDVDTDDYNPYMDNDAATTDDQAPTTDDDAAPTTDDDAANNDDDNPDDYQKKLMECLVVANQTSCEKNTPTDCVWCTTSFGEGLCVSEQAGHDVDGYFYTCQFNSTSTVMKENANVVESRVYDHYCWNVQNEEECAGEVDGHDVACVWSEEQSMCLSQTQYGMLEANVMQE